MREIGFNKRMRQLKNKMIALIYEIATKGFVVGFVLGISMTYLERPPQIPSLATNILAYKNRIIGLYQPNTEPLADVREPANVTLNNNNLSMGGSSSKGHYSNASDLALLHASSPNTSLTSSSSTSSTSLRLARFIRYLI